MEQAGGSAKQEVARCLLLPVRRGPVGNVAYRCCGRYDAGGAQAAAARWRRHPRPRSSSLPSSSSTPSSGGGGTLMGGTGSVTVVEHSGRCQHGRGHGGA
eukprot:SAG25_NODE_398_length_8498_cov_16.527206_1_plen_100_part_00